MSEHASPIGDVLPGSGKRPVRDALTPELEAEFKALFGEAVGVTGKPNPNRAAFEYAHKYFEGLVGPPEWASESQVAGALQNYRDYDIDPPVFFKQRGRVLARFSVMPIDVNPDAYSALFAPWQIISKHQVAQIKAGVFVQNLHHAVGSFYTQRNEELRPRPEGSSE